MRILTNYALQYSNNILNEIEIINPKLIVCCGKGLKNIIKMVYENNNKIIDKSIIEIYHPSYHFIKDTQYQNIFQQHLEDENIKVII